MYYLTATADFDSAHFLAGHDGKCANLHGHRWHIEAKLRGATLQENGPQEGMILDFADVKAALKELADSLDHTLIIQEHTLKATTAQALAEEGFSMVTLPFRPTAENLSRYIYEQLEQKGFPVCLMCVYETPNNCAQYEGGV